MSNKASSKDDEGDTGPGVAARLQRELADRERQLRDLTEQSLGFLEELAEARRLNGDRERLAERIGELERLLGDARSRLQHAGGCAPSKSKRGKKGQRKPPLEVVFWGEGSLSAALASRSACADVPVFWVGPPTAVPADLAVDAISTLVHRDAQTPAQCWNLGMAGTTADVVLFVGPGASLETAPVLPAAIAPNAVLLCPRVERDGTASIGCVERDSLLHLVPRAVPVPAPATPFPVPWAAPDAFVLRRAAFERTGAFDEGLQGTASLIDYVLRARRGNFDVLGVPSPAVVASATADIDEAHPRERLFVLAMHRPDQVGRAIADLPELWELGTAELATFLTALLARLPVADLSVQRAILDQITAGVVQNALPSAQVCSLVQSSRVALLRSCIDADLVGSEELEGALLRAESQVVAPAPAAFAALANDIAMCRNAARATSHALAATRSERTAIDTERHAQSARAERAEGARATTAQQLEQVQVWLREAQAEVRQLQAARLDAEQRLVAADESGRRAAADLQRSHADCQQLQQNLQAAEQERQRALQEAELVRAQLAQQLQEARQQNQQLERQLQQVQQQAGHLEQQIATLAAQHDEARLLGRQANERLAAQLESHRELEREFLAVDQSLRSMHEHTAELARIVGLADAGDRDGLERRLKSLLAEVEKFAATLRSAGAPDERALLTNLDGMAKRLANTERTLREREQWVAALLQEVTTRRLFPRGLQDHERAFLDRLGTSS